MMCLLMYCVLFRPDFFRDRPLDPPHLAVMQGYADHGLAIAYALRFMFEPLRGLLYFLRHGLTSCRFAHASTLAES